MAASNLTAERLRELLHYDPETGIFRWRVKRKCANAGDVAGSVNTNGYRSVTVHNVKRSAHRLAYLYMTGSWPKNAIDHRDHDRTNNRWANLRAVTNSVNCQNLTRALSNNKSGRLGVAYCPYRKTRQFKAMISVGGKQRVLGFFATADEAGAAYIAAKRKFHEGCTI
jgi:hypothetical protein